MTAATPAEHESRMKQLATYSKLRCDLLKAAPQFNGWTDFDAFFQEFENFVSEQAYMTEDIRRALLKGACTQAAREYLGSMANSHTFTYDQLAFVLRARYGKTTMSKKLHFDRLSQKTNETLYEYADRV